MALTVSSVRRHVNRGVRTNVFDVTFDDAYPTGGEALTAATLGLHVVQSVNAEPVGGYVFSYDRDNSKLLAYSAGGTITKPTFTVAASGAIGANMEVGLSADTAGATFEGGTGITAERTLTTTSPVGVPTISGALAEVANDTDLSAVITRVTAIGK